MNCFQKIIIGKKKGLVLIVKACDNVKTMKIMQTFNVIGRNTIYLLIDRNWVKLTLFVCMIVMENPKIVRFRIKFKWSAKEEIKVPKLCFVLYNRHNSHAV